MRMAAEIQNRRPAFFCDAMLGSLAKWLRLMGHDAAYERQIDDWEMLRRCSRERRVLLTRDRSVMQRWQIRRGLVDALLVGTGSLENELAEVFKRFGLRPLAQPRCPVDNSSLIAKPRQKVRESVPAYVYRTQTEFHVCPACGRIYWRATHWDRIEALRRKLASSSGL